MDTTASVRTYRAHAPQSRWRLAFLITALAGFFLMHGLSAADVCAGAAASLHSSTQSTAATSTAATGTQAEVAALGTHASPEATSADQCCAPMGTLCIPQRPQEPAWLLVMLLLGLAVLPSDALAVYWLDAAVRWLLATRRRPGAITPVRLLACVSRT